MGGPAVFFDLDRTLLRGGSAPVIARALQEVGLLRERNIPGEGLVYRFFDVFGESRLSMLATRNAARFTGGWPRATARQAGELAADALVAAVQPFAAPIIAAHKAAGRPVVLATTTPDDVVRPFALRVGFDDVIATRYGERDDGSYDGSIAGEFVWGPGKLRAVRAWAAEHDVDVEASWAYSDSWFDLPLLSAVAHPSAVNPDARLLAAAVLRRWPVLHLDVPEGVPKLPVLGVEPQQLAFLVGRAELVPYARFDVDGIDAVPLAGPTIVVANHRSYFDPVALGILFAKVGRPVRFLGKAEVFDAPVVGAVARAMGGIRVERGSGSDEPLRKAADALDAGQMVAILPQGTIPRGPAFFDPRPTARWGAARLAAMTGAPVIPVGLWGTEAVWPRSSRIPYVWNVLDPPTVRVRVGAPVEDLDPRSLAAATERIMSAIVDLLPAAAREPRHPTPEELARTYPSGRVPSPEETSGPHDRRPGSD